MRTGEIRNYNESRGFGFIRPSDKGQDAFFHITVFRGGINRLPNVGDWVEFESEVTAKGVTATAVFLVDPAYQEQGDNG